MMEAVIIVVSLMVWPIFIKFVNFTLSKYSISSMYNILRPILRMYKNNLASLLNV